MKKNKKKNPMLHNIAVLLRFQLKWGSLRSFGMTLRILWDMFARSGKKKKK